MNFNFTCCLFLYSIEKNNSDRYYLQIFTSDDPNSQQCIELDSTTLKSGTKPIEVRIKNTLTTKIGFYLYLKTNEDQPVPIINKDAWGYLTPRNKHSNYSIPLYDILHSKQGMLNITTTTQTTKNQMIQMDEVFVEDNNLAESINQISTMMNMYSYDPQQRFYSFQSSVGELPLLYYLIIAYRNSIYACKYKKDTIILLLKQLLIISCSFLSIDPYKPIPINRKEDLLSDLATLISRFLYYGNDYTRSTEEDGGGSRLKEDDCWTPLLSFPIQLLNYAMYDCEDCTETELEVLYLLSYIDLNKEAENGDDGLISNLKDLQTILNTDYTVCLTLTKLYTGDKDDQQTIIDGYVPHCTCILLDKRFVESKQHEEEGEYKPGILVEGTNYTSGKWYQTHEERLRHKDNEDHVFFKQEEAKGYNKWKDMIKTHLTTYQCAKQKLYGEVSRLLYISHDTKQPTHLFCLDQYHIKNGILLDDLLKYHIDPMQQLLTIEEWDQSKMNMIMKTNLKNIPFSNYPNITPSSLQVAIHLHSKYKNRFIFRTIDYNTNKSEFQNALERCKMTEKEGYKSEEFIIHLDSLSMTVIDLF